MTSASTRWGVLFLALFAGIFAAFQNGKMPAALPTLSEELGLTLVQSGWAVALLYCIACVLGLVAGAFADLWGARRFIAIGLALTGLASALGGLATGGAGLLAGRFFEGLGVMAVFVAAPAVIHRAAAAKDQRLAFGIWSGYMPSGTSTMILLTPLLIPLIGWRGIWWLNAAMLLGFAVFFLNVTRHMADPEPEAGRLARLKGDMRAVLRARGPWLLATSFATYTAGYLCVTAFLPTLLIKTAGWSQVAAGTATALVVFLNVPGNLFGGWLLQRGASRGWLIAIAAAAMGGLSLVIYADGLGADAKIIAACVYSFVAGLLPSSVMSGAPLHAPSPAQIGTTNGLVLQWANAGQLSAPPIFAAIASASGWPSAAWFTLGVGVLGVALGLAVAAHERRAAR